MEKRNDSSSTKNDELTLSFQGDEGHHKVYNEDIDSLASSDITDEVAVNTYQQNKALPLANNFSDIDLSTCTNVQIGTKIITSNLTLIEKNRSAFEVTEKSDPDVGKIPGDNDIYCQITCKTCFQNLWVKIIFATILLFILSFIIIEIFYDGKTANAENDGITKNISQMSHMLPVNYNTTWRVTRQEWGAHPARPCNKILTTTNKVKIMMTHMHCDSFSVCRETMQYKQKEFLKRHYDLFYHFGISEDGIIYEGLPNNCETRPAYRKCNDTFLVILIFLGSNICLDTDEVEQQIKSFNQIVKYNQNEGVLSNNSLMINLFNYCFDKYYFQLNKTYSDIHRYSVDMELSC